MFQLFTVSVVTNRYVCVFVHIILYILLLLTIVALNNPKGVWHSSPSIWSYTRPLISYSCLFLHVPLSVQYGVSWFTSLFSLPVPSTISCVRLPYLSICPITLSLLSFIVLFSCTMVPLCWWPCLSNLPLSVSYNTHF